MSDDVSTLIRKINCSYTVSSDNLSTLLDDVIIMIPGINCSYSVSSFKIIGNATSTETFFNLI